MLKKTAKPINHLKKVILQFKIKNSIKVNKDYKVYRVATKGRFSNRGKLLTIYSMIKIVRSGSLQRFRERFFLQKS